MPKASAKLQRQSGKQLRVREVKPEVLPALACDREGRPQVLHMWFSVDVSCQ